MPEEEPYPDIKKAEGQEAEEHQLEAVRTIKEHLDILEELTPTAS